jgi:hypothetical protein
MPLWTVIIVEGLEALDLSVTEAALVGRSELHFIPVRRGGPSMRQGIARAVFSVGIAVLVLAAFAPYGAHSVAADPPSPVPFGVEQSEPISSPNSILVFAGRLSTQNLGETFLFNLGAPGPGPNYDNYIFGAAYDRDLFNLGHGFYFGVEVGIADRFGNYSQCCQPVIKSNSIVESAELWTGPQIRYAGILLFDLSSHWRRRHGRTERRNCLHRDRTAKGDCLFGECAAAVLPRSGAGFLYSEHPEPRMGPKNPTSFWRPKGTDHSDLRQLGGRL